MGDIVAVKGLGAIVEKVRDGADLIVVLLKAAEADADLRTRTDLADVLAEAGNTECDFTNYARKTISNASITVTEDASGQPVDISIGDVTWTDAGNGTNNTTAKLLVCEDGAADSDRVFLSAHDFVETTTGTDLVAVEDTDGFYGASQAP